MLINDVYYQKARRNSTKEIIIVCEDAEGFPTITLTIVEAMKLVQDLNKEIVRANEDT